MLRQQHSEKRFVWFLSIAEDGIVSRTDKIVTCNLWNWQYSTDKTI